MFACTLVLYLLGPPARSIADEVSALIDGDDLRAASARAEDGLTAEPPNYVFVQAHARAKRWAHVHRAAEQMLVRVPQEQREFRVLLTNQRDTAAKQLTELDVTIAPGAWAEGGTLAVALLEPDAPRPWMWTVDEVRKEASGWSVRLSPGTWNLTLKTRGGETTSRVTIVRGERRTLRFAGPAVRPGVMVQVRVASACLKRDATVRAADGRSQRSMLERRLPAGAPAGSRDFRVELPPGSYIFSLDHTRERQAVELAPGADAEVAFTCRDPGQSLAAPRSLRPLWFSLGASAVTGIAGAVVGGVGHTRGRTAATTNAELLDSFELSGSFDYGSCSDGDWAAGSACARAFAVEGEYSSAQYHLDLGRSLQLRGLGLGLGAAAIGVSLGVLPTLARTPGGRRRWLIADGVLGALAGVGGAVLVGTSHSALEGMLDGFESGASTGAWRADGDAFQALARPWMAGAALVGLGGALLLNTALVGLTSPRVAVRANASGLVIRF